MFVVLPLLILAVATRFVRRVAIDVPLSGEGSQRLKRRKKAWKLVIVVFALGWVALFSIGSLVAWLEKRGESSEAVDNVAWPAIGLVAITTFVLYPLTIIAITRLIQNNFGILLSDIKGDHLWLRGAHPAILSQLPRWRGDRVAASDSQ
jgi:hypothetical protein